MVKMLLNPKKIKNKQNYLFFFVCIIIIALANYDTINETMVNM